MNRIILTAVTALVISPVFLAAQGVEDAARRIDHARQRAQAAGIPVSLLETKIAEGKAKGVPLDRIAAAVERREEALVRAREAMGGGSDLTDADLAVGADALQVGVNAAVLGALSQTERSGRRAVAIAALTQLVQLGYVPEEALARVQEALQRGPDALANLPAEAEHGRGVGGLPAGFGGGRPGGVGAPAGVPAPGQKPGAGRPPGVGKPVG